MTVDFSYAEGLEAHMDEGGKVSPGNVRDVIHVARQQHDELTRLRFRIAALREGLRDVATSADADAMRSIAKNALHCDDERK